MKQFIGDLAWTYTVVPETDRVVPVDMTDCIPDERFRREDTGNAAQALPCVCADWLSCASKTPIQVSYWVRMIHELERGG